MALGKTSQRKFEGQRETPFLGAQGDSVEVEARMPERLQIIPGRRMFKLTESDVQDDEQHVILEGRDEERWRQAFDRHRAIPDGRPSDRVRDHLVEAGVHFNQDSQRTHRNQRRSLFENSVRIATLWRHRDDLDAGGSECLQRHRERLRSHDEVDVGHRSPPWLGVDGLREASSFDQQSAHVCVSKNGPHLIEHAPSHQVSHARFGVARHGSTPDSTSDLT